MGNSKLIKIEQDFFVINDDDIKEGWRGYAYKHDLGGKIYKHIPTTNPWYNDAKEVTHSTKEGVGILLNISDVEEAVYGYSENSLYKKSLKEWISSSNSNHIAFYKTNAKFKDLWRKGFKSHQELVKDKLFGLEDIENIWNKFVKEEPPINNGSSSSFLVYLKQKLLPKTEWGITIDENKITLLV